MVEDAARSTYDQEVDLTGFHKRSTRANLGTDVRHEIVQEGRPS
jgi:hypothetical protein